MVDAAATGQGANTDGGVDERAVLADEADLNGVGASPQEGMGDERAGNPSLVGMDQILPAPPQDLPATEPQDPTELIVYLAADPARRKDHRADERQVEIALQP